MKIWKPQPQRLLIISPGRNWRIEEEEEEVREAETRNRANTNASKPLDWRSRFETMRSIA